MEVQGKRLADAKTLPTEPGEFKICCNDKGEPARLVFACPCGCGDIGGVGLPPGNQQGPTWQWNGDWDKPTTTPSIKFLSGCQWHGYLTDGVFNGECEGPRPPRIDGGVRLRIPSDGSVCPECGGKGIIPGDPTAPADSILRHDVPCPECQEI